MLKKQKTKLKIIFYLLKNKHSSLFIFLGNKDLTSLAFNNNDLDLFKFRIQSLLKYKDQIYLMITCIKYFYTF